MKARILLPVILLTACFISCQKETLTDNNKANESSTSSKQGIPPDGGPNTSCNNWIVSSFNKYGTNSGDFNGYTFVFCSDQTVKAINGQTTVNGGWSTNALIAGTSVTYYMTLFFDTNPSSPLVILNTEWLMPERTDNIIHLRRTNEEGTIEIVFTRQ